MSRVLESQWNALAQCSQPHGIAHYNSIMAAVPHYRQDPAFEAAWRVGEKLSLDAALQLALKR